MNPQVYGNTLDFIWSSHICLQNQWELRDLRLQLYWHFILKQLCGFEANFLNSPPPLYQLLVQFLCTLTGFILVETRAEVLL